MYNRTLCFDDLPILCDNVLLENGSINFSILEDICYIIDKIDPEYEKDNYKLKLYKYYDELINYLIDNGDVSNTFTIKKVYAIQSCSEPWR